MKGGFCSIKAMLLPREKRRNREIFLPQWKENSKQAPIKFAKILGKDEFEIFFALM
jgi:hypothetical protein